MDGNVHYFGEAFFGWGEANPVSVWSLDLKGCLGSLLGAFLVSLGGYCLVVQVRWLLDRVDSGLTAASGGGFRDFFLLEGWDILSAS